MLWRNYRPYEAWRIVATGSASTSEEVVNHQMRKCTHSIKTESEQSYYTLIPLTSES